MKRAAAVLAIALLAGCGSVAASQNVTPPAGDGRGSGSLVRSVSHASPSRRTSGDPWLYASDQLDNDVVAYDLAQPGFPVVQTISQGVSTPGEVALDAHGTLYVVNNGNGTVTECPPAKAWLALR